MDNNRLKNTVQQHTEAVSPRLPIFQIKLNRLTFITLWICYFHLCFPASTPALDLEEIKKKGVLRHLAVPYANFVKVENEPAGMSIELARLFAQHIGVKYEFVQSDWNRIIQELTGKNFKVHSNSHVEVLNAGPSIKGDLICTGFTVLPWRKKLLTYSTPTFPTQIWAITRRNTIKETIPSTVDRRKPSAIKSFIQDRNYSVLGKADTCLDPILYGLEKQGKYFDGPVNDIALAVLENKADLGILDSPDTLIALRKWPDKLQVLGPVSEKQTMAVGFRNESKELKAEFNRFLQKIKKNGIYQRIVKKYYPDIFFYFPKVFKQSAVTRNN